MHSSADWPLTIGGSASATPPPGGANSSAFGLRNPAMVIDPQISVLSVDGWADGCREGCGERGRAVGDGRRRTVQWVRHTGTVQFVAADELRRVQRDDRPFDLLQSFELDGRVDVEVLVLDRCLELDQAQVGLVDRVAHR